MDLTDGLQVLVEQAKTQGCKPQRLEAAYRAFLKRGPRFGMDPSTHGYMGVLGYSEASTFDSFEVKDFRIAAA